MGLQLAKELHMRVKLTGIAGLLIPVLVVGFLSIPNLAAQDKAQKAEKAADKKGAEKANIQGTIQNMSKETSTITVRVGSGTVTRQVVYSPSTKWMVGHSNDNKPGALAQVKVTNFISCVGTFDAKSQLLADQCIYREGK
jgi:hypothetical protein